MRLIFITLIILSCTNVQNKKTPNDPFKYGVKHVLDESGHVKEQLLISPLGDTLHKVLYDKDGKITSSEGEYFYSITGFVDSLSDENVFTYEFEYHIILLDSNLITNIYLYEYVNDSIGFEVVEQKYVDKPFISIQHSFKKLNPIINMCVAYAHKDGKIEITECYEPYVLGTEETNG